VTQADDELQAGDPGADAGAAHARHLTLILVLCCLGSFLVVLDVSIVNTALPVIRRSLDFSAVELQWVVNAYGLTFAGFLLLGGRASDILGRREMLAAGMGLLAVASLAGGLAPSKDLLIAARAAQGLAGAIIFPATLSVLMTTFREGADRNRVLGLWAAIGGVGGTSGALFGGILTQLLSWRWILLINFPFGIVGALAVLRVVPRGLGDRHARRSFDFAGALTVTAGLITLSYAIVGTEQHGWGSQRTLGVAAVGIALLATFLLIEARIATAPLVPLRLFRSRSLSGASLVVACMGAGTFGMWYLVSLYLQQVLGYNPIEAGLVFLPMNLMIVLCPQIASRLTTRFGGGIVLTGGLALISLGNLLFSGVSADGSYLADVLAPSLVVTAGHGLSLVTATILASTGVRGAESGLVSGVVSTSRQIGGSLGLALLATVAAQRTADLSGAANDVALAAGYQRAFVVASAIAALGAVTALALLVLRRPRAIVVADSA